MKDAMNSDSNLTVSVLEQSDKNLSKKFTCIFQDSTNSKGSVSKFHLSLPAYHTVQDLYLDVSKKTSYKNGTFLLKYTRNIEEQIIDENCDDALFDIVGDSQEKRHNFSLINKDENGPVTVIVDSIDTSIYKVR